MINPSYATLLSLLCECEEVLRETKLYRIQWDNGNPLLLKIREIIGDHDDPEWPLRHAVEPSARCPHGATSEEVCPECLGVPSDNPDDEIAEGTAEP